MADINVDRGKRVQPLAPDSNRNNPDLREVFDSAARYFVKMSGDEFAAAWNAGHFHNPDPDLHPGVVEVASLAPAGILTR